MPGMLKIYADKLEGRKIIFVYQFHFLTATIKYGAICRNNVTGAFVEPIFVGL